MIKVICFDLDGVYFLNGKSNFLKALDELGVSENGAKRVFLNSNEMNKQYKIGRMTDEEFWSLALKEWNLQMTTQDIMDLLINDYETNPFVVEYVKKVKDAGYKTAICSSNFPARINGLQKRFGFLDDFDVITKSCVEPSEIVYSDDYEPAINTAKEWE